MKPWKTVLGFGAACAACCAIPLLGSSAALAAFGSALVACAAELLPAALAVLAVALGFAGAWLFRRRQAAGRASCGCTAANQTGGV